MPTSRRIMVAVCKWEDKLTVSNWVPLYSPLPNNNSAKNYDAYGRQFGEPYFQCPRKPQKQETIDDIRYYCFEDYGEKILVYKEINE